jgi:hypothetical protein
MNIVFTDYWVSGFGWEPTIYCVEDFATVELLGDSRTDGIVFLAIDENGSKYILKGYYK